MGAAPDLRTARWARGRALRGAHNMEIPGTPPPSPSLACGRRRPASKPRRADFRLPHKVARPGPRCPPSAWREGRTEAVMGAGGGPSDAIHPIEGPGGVVRPVQALGRAGHREVAEVWATQRKEEKRSSLLVCGGGTRLQGMAMAKKIKGHRLLDQESL